MTAGPAAPFMSIGEVLNLLQDEFPEVTVSKLRFLESEGLVHPERTESGYRKFSDADVERLRYILRLQRDQFLPLKVIRERLDELDARGASTDGQSEMAFSSLSEEPAETPPVTAEDQDAPPADEVVFAALTGVSLSLAELGRASGLTEERIGELEQYGLLHATESDDGQARYDEVALESAKLCRELLDLGLEARHLRMFRSSADRWAALAEQMVMPLVKQRNPEARKAASQTVRELVRVGNRLLQTLLREAVGPYA